MHRRFCDLENELVITSLNYERSSVEPEEVT